MHSVCRTQLKRTILFSALTAVIVIAIAAAIVMLFGRTSDLMDPNAVAGQPPVLDEQYRYTELSPQNLCTIGLCGMPEVDGKNVHLYLTNPSTNEHLVRAEIYTAKQVTNPATGEVSFEPEKLLGKTGFITPGSYVQTLELEKALKDAQTRVYIKIALRNAENGNSEGYFHVGTVLVK